MFSRYLGSIMQPLGISGPTRGLDGGKQHSGGPGPQSAHETNQPSLLGVTLLGKSRESNAWLRLVAGDGRDTLRKKILCRRLLVQVNAQEQAP